MINPNFCTQVIEENDNFGKFIIEPLPASFGQSMAHALRRTLLSSLQGAAITDIRFEGHSHLFETIKGVKESILEMVLNLKQLRFKTKGEGPFKIELSSNSIGKLFGKDIKGNIEIVNKDLYIAEITAVKSKLEFEAIVDLGRGYFSVEEREKKESGYIPVDAFFSPVKKVNFRVEGARVGRKTNFDRLIFEIMTDGSIKPSLALRQSAQYLSDYFSFILSGKDVKKSDEETDSPQQNQIRIDQRLNEIIIDELNLPSRVINALLREKIETVADLVKIGKDQLKTMKGVGKKSIELIVEELKKMGVDLNLS